MNAAFNAVQGGSRSGGANSGRRTTPSSNMNSTAAGIVLLASGLERLYQRRHQPFGVQMFKALRIRAEEVQRGVRAVAKAQTRSAAESAAKRLDEGIVSLVVQFQAASGGYGAARCSPGAWTCCEPKRSKDLLQSEQVACMWGCVRTAQTCTGFLGPRIRRPEVDTNTTEFWAAFVFPMSIKCLDFGSCFPFRLHFFAPLLRIFVLHRFHFLRDIRMLLHDVLPAPRAGKAGYEKLR